MNRLLVSVVLLSLFASCAQLSSSRQFPDMARETDLGYDSRRIQGMLGLTELSNVDLDLDPAFGTVQDDGATSLPMLGAAGQQPLVGRRVKIGVEGGFTAGWEGDTGVVAVNNNTVLVVSDNDVLLIDFFVGVYAETFLGQHARLYAGAGPLLQWGRIDLEYIDDMGSFVSLGESGFGGGTYARAGVEFELSPGSFVGFGVRWLDSSVSLGGGLEDFEFEGLQYAITATVGI